MDVLLVLALELAPDLRGPIAERDLNGPTDACLASALRLLAVRH
jgi:hypothetical protein